MLYTGALSAKQGFDKCWRAHIIVRCSLTEPPSAMLL